MREILKRLRQYEIKIRKAINFQMQGDFHSVFKGSGLDFDDVRAYQYGDDIRTINWNVSAKGHGTFVNTYKEDKEQSVFFIVDVSASQEIGSEDRQKIDVAKEICGVLALSAVKENSQTGLFCFSDQKEKYIKPGKGQKHAYQIISELIKLRPQSRKTSIHNAIVYALHQIKRRSVIILISDFIDEDFTHDLKALAGKHDLIVIHISENRETNLPKLGIVPLYDNESKKTIWVNSSSPAFRKMIKANFSQKHEWLEDFCRKQGANYLNVDAKEDYVPKLIQLFRIRNKAGKIA
ncbi:MAG TPA: DUF58 domain-containing protein [Cytophagales bacterium]|jgi:uncharacterized protein (DUF58 family)|nr:DUF58 domain-containing protein [Cytophagales bacterium]